jgi:NAD(P)-dependent dehydrogenase (short-subunit alcohol dehydrogenase family)
MVIIYTKIGEEEMTRVALVTGGGFGMGREHCLVLAAQGMRVAVNDIDREAARATAGSIREAGGKSLAVPGDVSSRSEIEFAVGQIGDAWGCIDVVVSNAGTIHSGTGLLDTDDQEWHRTLAVHVGGCLNVTRAAIPWLLQSRSGRIIIVGSAAGQRGRGHSYAYVTAKGALAAFGRNLAKEFGYAGICVNTVAPGSVRTRMAADSTDEDISEDCKQIPLGRWGTIEEISAVVSFLASENASYITGQTIGVNGGMIICGA